MKKTTDTLRDDLVTLMIFTVAWKDSEKPIRVSECGYELPTPRMRRVLTDRYSFLTNDLEDLARKCITKANVLLSKCRSVLLSHICFLRIERSVKATL